MKRYLMLFVALMMISSVAHSQTSGYLGLFTDQTRTSWCNYPASVPTAVLMYVIALPSVDGLRCVEFAVDYAPESTNILPSQVTYNPIYTVALGDINTGLSVCYGACQTDWFYAMHQMIIVYDRTMYTMSIQPHSGTGHVYFASCIEPERPKYDAIPFTNFYINATNGVDPQCGETASTPASWGAIKSLYN